jgi:hypothetical protein
LLLEVKNGLYKISSGALLRLRDTPKVARGVCEAGHGKWLSRFSEHFTPIYRPILNTKQVRIQGRFSMGFVYRLLVLAILSFFVGAVAGALRSGGLVLFLSADGLIVTAVTVDIGILALILYEDFGKPYFLGQNPLSPSS